MSVLLALMLLSFIFASTYIAQTASSENDLVGNQNVGENTAQFAIESSLSVDWWPMFHHDLRRTGYSTSTAPITNYTLWSYVTIGPWDSSPVVADGVVYVVSGRMMYALNLTTGSLKWSYDLRQYTNGYYEYCWASAPTFAGGVVFASVSIGRVHALNASTGVSVWNSSVGGCYWSSPAVVNDKVFVGSDHSKIYALNETTGQIVWSHNTTLPTQLPPGFSSPAIAGGKVFIACGSVSWGYNNIYALNETTGELLWNRTTGRLGYYDPVRYSSPSVADGMVFWGSSDGRVYALNETNGEVIWSYPTEDWVSSSPAVAYGKVFVGSYDGNVYALDEWTGNHIWNYSTKGYVYSSPAVADSKVFVGSDDGMLYTLNQTDGELMWSYAIGPGSCPAVVDGKVFIVGGDRLYSLGGNYTHDVAVTGLNFSKSVAEFGETIYIYVNVQNEGIETETFNVNAFFDSNIIETQTVTLTPGQAQNITFTWNTSGVASRTNTIKAEADVVSGEINIEDDVYIDGTIILTPRVGGIVVPVDKLGLLAPYIALAIAVVAITIGAVYARKRWTGKAVIQTPRNIAKSINPLISHFYVSHPIELGWLLVSLRED